MYIHFPDTNTSQIKDLHKIYKEYFQDNKDGFFVEVGAYDGWRWSNTLSLVESHWSGIMIEPIDKCISHLKKFNDYSEVIFMTPDAKKLTQKISNKLSISGNLIILCGHYKGIDQRVRDNLVTMELSIGDYVLSGGELPAAVLCDSIIRLIPGVLNDETSALEDSFQDGLIAPPVYTRPSKYKNLKVPEILLSGDPKKVKEWREKKSDEKTKLIKP